MKKQLYELFSQFGPILEIVMNKARRMRGQAFIVFKDINTATLAMRKMNGFEFNGKPLVTRETRIERRLIFLYR